MPTANVERIGLECMAAALRPPPPVDYLRWAEQHIVFDEGPFPGPYNSELFPYFDAVLQALGPDDPCRYVTLCASAQTGKTALATIFALASISASRGSFLFCHPTTDNAVRWSKMKLAPLMKSTRAVREQFPTRTADSLASVLYKERRDGLSRLLITGANSPASLSQVSINFQVQDDLSKFEVNAMGDPELMADARSRAMADAKIFKISTPLVEPGCRISRNFRDGSQEMPFVSCPHCTQAQILQWDFFTVDPADPDSAHFVCVACGGVIEEHHRPQMLAGFEWRAQNPAAAKEHRSFWIWSAYSYLQSWPQIGHEWLRAKGDPASEKSFWNDTLGKAYETRGDGRPWEELRDRALKSNYGRGEIPRGCLLLFLGVDVQGGAGSRLEWVLLGVGNHHKRYIIDIGAELGHIGESDTQHRLDQLLARTWTNALGRTMPISLAAIDGGYASDDVISYVRKHSPSKLIAVRGVAGDATPRIQQVMRERDEKLGTPLRYAKRFFNLGIYAFKGALYRDLMKDDAELPGFVAFPRDLPDRFYQELVSEARVAHKRLGQIVYRWEKLNPRQANECLDATVYASGAALKFGTHAFSDARWARLRQELESFVPDDDKPPSVKPPIAAARRLAS